MDVLSFSKVPTLKRPILLLAFAGWNDAGNAATFAAKFLLQRLQGQNFATLDPEIFYNFSEQRPHVRFSGGEREIIWPANEFAYASDPQLAQGRHHRAGCRAPPAMAPLHRFGTARD